jgi:hypothetical protein
VILIFLASALNILLSMYWEKVGKANFDCQSLLESANAGVYGAFYEGGIGDKLRFDGGEFLLR